MLLLTSCFKSDNMLRKGRYVSFEDRFDDWVDRWWRQAAFPDFPSSELDRATSNRMKYHAYNLPVVGDIFKAGAQWNELQDYMSAYGYGWADIDPLRASDKFGGSNTKAANAALKLSKNVLKLYR